MNITTKICLGATILFSIVGIVIGFSKKGGISDLKKKYDQAKLSENQLTSKNTKIISLQNDIKTVTVERDGAKSKLATAKQNETQALTDKGTADRALTTANEDHDETKKMLKGANKLLEGAKRTNATLTDDRDDWKEKYERERARRGNRPGPVATTPKNPTAAVGTEGKVVVNNANQFVIIDIGKNKGLTRGSILEVWDGAIFIGKILVVDPEPMGNPAVAIANIDSGATTGTIAKGHVVKLVSP